MIVISCFIHITSCALAALDLPAALDLTVWEMNIAEPVHSEVEEALESYGFEKTSEENQKSIYTHFKYNEQLYCIDYTGGGTKVTAVLFKPALSQSIDSKIVFDIIRRDAQAKNIEIDRFEIHREYVEGLCP